MTKAQRRAADYRAAKRLELELSGWNKWNKWDCVIIGLFGAICGAITLAQIF